MADIDVKVAALEERQKVANKRIDDLEETTKRIESLTLSVQKLAISVESMTKEQLDYRQKQNELAEKVLAIENKPYKDKSDLIERIAWYVFTTVAGIVIGWLFTTLFN